jgi:hypothetical protein
MYIYVCIYIHTQTHTLREAFLLFESLDILKIHIIKIILCHLRILVKMFLVFLFIFSSKLTDDLGIASKLKLLKHIFRHTIEITLTRRGTV